MTELRSALILGASGRIGQMLRHVGLCGLAARWQYRSQVKHDDAIAFDPLRQRADLSHFDVVLCLAGVTTGRPADLGKNTDLAEAAVDIGLATGARRVFIASSAAVYGRAQSPLREDAALQPVSPYGCAKAAMEDATFRRAAQSNLPVTILRIGNVAGADALLGQRIAGPLSLDRFADGQGPRRSYIGPADLAMVLQVLLLDAVQNRDLPSVLNLALPPSVAMADLLQAAGLSFNWRPAPDIALPVVELDTSLLSQWVALPKASACRIVTDWQSYRQACA